MKQQILKVIYNSFDDWASDDNWACQKGCASCCTQNVTITALEGEVVLNYIIAEGREEWLMDRLQGELSPQRPQQTLNSFARSCMAGENTETPDQTSFSPCPFLDQNCCSIYPARPFNCRCFLSLHSCSPDRPALISEEYLAASTAVNQLIEHLGQREYWGNMLDVLPSLLDISAYRSISNRLFDKTAIVRARVNTLVAQPLPGFMLSEEDFEKVSPLLENIFTQQVDGKTVKDILNGK
jgi:Fe-S-cluster containining protein